MQTAIEIQDPYYRERRIREYKQYMDYFAKQLYRIYCLVPHPGCVIKNGVMEQLPIAKEWQQLIDKVLEMRDECIKTNFPEFYETRL